MTRLHLSTFLRGMAIVTLTAMNIGQISAQHWGGAFLCGAAISWVWYLNARHAGHDDMAGLREAYALGAGCGTVFGMWIVKVVYG